MKTISQIKELIAPLSASSWNETLRQLLQSPDGFIYTQNAAASDNAIFNLFGELPPHTDYDFNLKHFFLNLPPNGNFENELRQLFTQSHPIVHFFENEQGGLSLEQSFLIHAQSQRSKTPPLLLNFSSRLQESQAPSFLDLRRKTSRPYEIVHVGIQAHCTHRETMDALLTAGDQILFWDDIVEEGLLKSLEKETPLGEKRAVWIRIDLDALAQSQGGNSFSWPTGIYFKELMETLSWLLNQNLFYGASIGPFEPSSLNNNSLRAAAQLTSHIIHAESARRAIAQFHGSNRSQPAPVPKRDQFQKDIFPK